jgi:hypothetical protein
MMHDHLVEHGNIRDLCYGVLLAGVLVVLTWALSGCGTPRSKPVEHNEQWFFSQACPHASATWAFTVKYHPDDLDFTFFDLCANEMRTN